jgi:two-component sensor histidine kinase
MGTRLYEELETLRDLNERQELEKAKRALEESGRQKDMLIKEVDHRVKNSLQIVSSLLYMQAKTAGAAASHFHSAAARVSAIAVVHQQLHKTDDIGTVTLDRYVTDLCKAIETASSDSNKAWSLKVDTDPLIISTDTAVPLAVIVNELVTNAIQHSRPAGDGGQVRILLKTSSDKYSISVSDSGEGPAATHSSGLGTRIVDAFARQIHATVTRHRVPGGYAVTVTVPHLVERVPG